MKKVIVFLVALMCLIALLTACANSGNVDGDTNVNIGGNEGTGTSSSTGSNDTTDNDAATDQTTTFVHRGFEITLPDYYTNNGNDMWESWGEDRTEIWALDYDLVTMMAKYSVDESLEELTKAYVKEQQIEGELLMGKDDNYYILTEGESDGQPWTELLLFFLDEETFWEVRFYSNSRTWEDAQDQWNSYIDTIEFD